MGSRTASPDRTLVNLIKHPSLIRHGNHAYPSISADNDGEEKSGLKRSLNKLKGGNSRRNSEDTERRSSFEVGRRLSKLVPHVNKPRKSPRSRTIADEDEIRRNYGVEEPDGAGLGITARTPRDSVDQRPESLTSSLLTDDDEDSGSLARPFLDTRASHAGYLTLSSPLINPQALDGPATVTISSLPTNSDRNLKNVQLSPNLVRSGITPEELPTIESELQSEAQHGPVARTLSPQRLSVKATDLNTPVTVVTPPTPDTSMAASDTDTSPRRKSPFRLGLGGAQARPVTSPPQSNDFVPAQRRMRSGTVPGAKIFSPLTPAIEEAKTPGGSLIQPSGSFFSSVFSATQNAVSQISNSFTNTTATMPQKALSSGGSGSADGEEVIVTQGQQAGREVTSPTLLVEPAIATIGSGNLSFSHLGLSESSGEQGSMLSKDTQNSHVSRSPSIVQRGTFPNRTEEASAAEAISAAYVEKPQAGKALSTASEGASERPTSVHSGPGSIDDRTPPASFINGAEGSINKRSNSVRSRLSERRKRHRNSSIATGSAITAAIGVSNSASANSGGKSKSTGFAVASNKRNKDFHQLFKSVPEDDFLLEDYSAALQRDILLQGRLYVSERNVCFSSNILGWVTNLVINFDDVVAMEKKMTAVIFPNAILIQTLHSKNTFASLIGREATYDLLLGVWKSRHPNLKTTEHGHSVDSSADEGKAGDVDSSDESEEASEEYYDEDEEDDDDAESGGFLEAHDAEGSEEIAESTRPSVGGSSSPKRSAEPQEVSGSTAGGDDFQGPTTHAPTECTDQDKHYEKLLLDTTIPAPLGKVYTMVFGPQSGVVMRKFFVDDQKSGDVHIDDDKKGLGKDQKTFLYSYVKNLNSTIGPRTTKCMVTQTLDFFDLQKAVSVTCSTQTPDVPSGSVFVTKTKYCLMWGPNNSTRFIANCAIEWSGKSWIKGPIEKGANDGQLEHCKDLIAFIKTQLQNKTGKSASKAVKGKGSKRKRSSDEAGHSPTRDKSATATYKRNKGGNMAVLEPIVDLFNQMSTSTVVLGTLLIFVVLLWIRQSYWSHSASRGGVYQNRASMVQKLAAYEEMWQREESDLWNWLDDRIGLEDLGTPVAVPNERMKDRTKAKSMSDRQVDEAIRVTEERLKDLKKMVERKREKR